VDGAMAGKMRFHEVSLNDVKGDQNARPRVDLVSLVSGGKEHVGSVIYLRDGRGSPYQVQVAGAGTTSFWDGSPEPVQTWILTYTSEKHAEPQPLCTAGVNEAILYTGDRYDSKTRTITATGEEARGAVNIACAGTVLAKLYLTRHTETSQRIPTTRAERQAMFKMLSGDVCGDGTSFTVPGQPLLWQDVKGVTRFAGEPGAIEAVWSEAGAVCLDGFRLPEAEAAIEAHCGRLPRCGGGEGVRRAGYVTSALPL
jgi:hypothetical protein